MGLKITLVGSQDHELEGAIRACGATLSQAPMSVLGSLGQTPSTLPDVLVVDLRDHVGVPPALTVFTRQFASTGVVIVAKTLDPELMLSAMRAGANEVLAEPVTQGDLDAAFTRVVAQSTPTGSQTFAFIGVKGGVGATALAVNVATALARVAKAGALMIDLHVTHGDAALYLGVEPSFSVTDAFASIHKIDETFFRSLITRGPSRLDLLAARENALAPRPEAGKVRALLDFTSKHFEFTVVDVPRNEPGAVDGLDSAKSIVVVTNQELPSVRNAGTMAKRIEQRYGKDKVMVVTTRLDKQSEITVEDIQQLLGMPIAHSFPNDYRTTLAALTKGRPVVLDNHNSLASSYEKFARSLAGLQSPGPKKDAGGSMLGWITGRK